MQETWVQSLGWDNPLEKEMATHSGRGAWWATVHGGGENAEHDLLTKQPSSLPVFIQATYKNVEDYRW